jgi:hypothetical protein
LIIKDLPDSEVQKVLSDAENKGNARIVRRLIQANPLELYEPLELTSEQSNERARIDLTSIMRELAQNTMFLLPHLKRAAMGGLLTQAYESTADHHDRGGLWEFLRHCRNAAAHGGRFHFLYGEPRRLAQWGKFRIERSLQGTNLAAMPEEQGLLAPGDALRLLWDIEQAYPSMMSVSTQ